MSNTLNRRQFMGHAAVGGMVLTAGAPFLAEAESPSNRIVAAIVGLGRGRALAGEFARADNCTVKYVCDLDENRLPGGVAAVSEAGGNTPEAVGDMRRIFDDPEVDVVAFALPVHWHAPAAIMACKAGKHVYVEKPCCHNPHEGELLVEAGRKYNRAVQMGAQRRSSVVIREGLAKLQEGVIGRPYFARTWYSAVRGSMGIGVEAPVPGNLDYETWQGPAPRRPYKDNVVHYNWHWLWHYGTGEMGNNGTHMVDLGRWGLGVDYPIRVTSTGGRYRFEDDQETPDTHVVTYDFGGCTMTWEGLSCNQPGPDGMSVGVALHGDKGSLTLGSTNYILRDGDGKIVAEKNGDLGGKEHVANLLDAIRNDTPLALNTEIEEGYKSTLLAHLGNIAHRTGRSLRCGDKGHILDDTDAQALWQREYEPGWEPTL